MASALTLVPPTDAQIQRAALCDECGELQRLDKANKTAHAPVAARLKIVLESIQKLVPADLPGDKDISFEGNVYTVTASIRTNESSITSMAKLAKFLGTAKFYALAKIGVGALEELIGKAGAAIWFQKNPTGYRTITAVAKARPEGRPDKQSA
jgi:hypothetical protein